MIHEVPYVTGLYLPLYQHILKNAFDELFSRGKKFDLKLIMRTSSGIPKWIRKIAKPVLRDSEVVAVIGYYQEITKNNLLDIEAARYRSRLDFTPLNVRHQKIRAKKE